MAAMELSPEAQRWLLVVLVWIGFGTLAGLVARLVLPFHRPTHAVGTVALGIVGSAVGLGIWSLLADRAHLNPISPLGFAAAIVGAVGVFCAYQAIAVWNNRRNESSE